MHEFMYLKLTWPTIEAISIVFWYYQAKQVT